MFEKYISLAQPAVHLRTARSSAFTKVGGMPCLPPEWDWPEVDGWALPFVLQVDLGDVYATLPSFLPSKGALYFFFDQKRYCDDRTQDSRWWRVLFYASNPTVLSERACFSLDAEQTYNSKPLKTRRIESLPSHYRFPGEFESDVELKAYVELSLRPLGRSFIHHQILGHASLLQEGFPELECERRSREIERYLEPSDPAAAPFVQASRQWRLLCQIDTDEEAGWMWGDAGTIYFWIREEDARCANFRSAWMTFESL